MDRKNYDPYNRDQSNYFGQGGGARGGSQSSQGQNPNRFSDSATEQPHLGTLNITNSYYITFQNPGIYGVNIHAPGLGNSESAGTPFNQQRQPFFQQSQVQDYHTTDCPNYGLHPIQQPMMNQPAGFYPQQSTLSNPTVLSVSGHPRSQALGLNNGGQDLSLLGGFQPASTLPFY